MKCQFCGILTTGRAKLGGTQGSVSCCLSCFNSRPDYSKPLAYLAERRTTGPHGLFASSDTRLFKAKGWAERWAKRAKWEHCTVKWTVTPLYAKPEI